MTSYLFIYTYLLSLIHADIKLLVEMLLKIMIGKGIDEGNAGWRTWSNDKTHRADSKRRNIFENIWEGGALPWRLTDKELKELDEQMSRIVWPHYVDRLHYDKFSFWVKRSRLWKTHRKVNSIMIVRYKTSTLITYQYHIKSSGRFIILHPRDTTTRSTASVACSCVYSDMGTQKAGWSSTQLR